MTDATQSPAPKRNAPPPGGAFPISRGTRRLDRFMTQFVKVGGLGIIAAVAGIFVFILWQILPLFQGADVREIRRVPVGLPDAALIGTDEWTELPFLASTDGTLTFVEIGGETPPRTVRPPFEGEKSFTSLRYVQENQQILYGTSDGSFCAVRVKYAPEYDEDGRRVVFELEATPFFALGGEAGPVREIAWGDAGEEKLAAAIQENEEGLEVHAVLLEQRRTLLGGGEIEVSGRFDLTGEIEGKPVDLRVNGRGDAVLVSNDRGEVAYFARENDRIEKRQTFAPFADLSDPRIVTMDFLFGDVSVVFTGAGGENRLYSFYPQGEEYTLRFGPTKELPPLSGGADWYAPSLRNKGFLLGGGGVSSLRYGTTEAIRWEETLPFSPVRGVISGKYDRILFLDERGDLRLYRLDDPHPEAGLRAFFGKVWYEGQSEPAWTWQSTGGTDEFEPKLSMVPLIVGTLKGTLYAMLIALPVALLAGIYTSQFASRGMRGWIKPVMEIMASLPSVILGFLAALWLAPLIETRVPSVLLALIAVPAVAFAFGWFWSRMPYRVRIRIRPGWEFVVCLPLFLLTAYGAWECGPLLERWLFTVTDPETGRTVADFRLWWPQATGTSFEQRNALIVGFMMGFAVIPIIFTITEDALSSVPPAYRSGSLALGASRWQTVLRVIVPTASPGIFSAVMIGLGRAVGETMIVLMATGNTPIMEWNIFSGFRTLSANIAVELPEAPHHGTLYRTLFLGGMLLFLMTFLVNTLAEVLRQHLRNKYKAV